MLHKGKNEECQAGAPAWMVTFADMMSLLLTFFVLLLSFSNIEIVKFTTMAGAIRGAFGLRSEFDISSEPLGGQLLPKPAPRYDKRPERPSQNLITDLRKSLEKANMQDAGTVEINERGIALRLTGDAVFETGKTDLSSGARRLLEELVAVAENAPGKIEVEGHTDDVPIRNSRFPSNWELSAARAGSAVRFLSAQGLPAVQMKAIGYADTRPLVPNDSAENRAKNRRIEILFLGKNEDDRSAADRNRGA